MNTRDQVADLFAYSHLPPELGEASRPFCDMALRIWDSTPEDLSEYRDRALFDLWNAKNVTVWIAAQKMHRGGDDG